MSSEVFDKGCDITIFNEIGDCFTTGIVFGGLWNFAKGFSYVPKNRFKAGIFMVRDRAALMGGSIGVWGTLYHLIYCGIKMYRQTSDIVNVVYSGFLVSVIINIRSSGFKAAFQSGIGTGLFLLIICGMLQGQAEAKKKHDIMRQNIEYSKNINAKNRMNIEKSN